MQEALTHVRAGLDSYLNGDIDTAFQALNLDTHDKQCGQSDVMTAANSVQQFGSSQVATDGASSDDDEMSHADDMSNDADAINDYLKPPVMHRHWQPLVTVVEVPALPKGALVEVQPEAFTVHAIAPIASSSSSSDEDDDDSRLGEAGEMQPGRHAQTDTSRMQSWPGQLRSHQHAGGGQQEVQCQSLVSLQTYCSCQVSFQVSSDTLGAVREVAAAAVGVITQQLKRAGLTAQHVMHACLYVHQMSHLRQEQLRIVFDKVWQSRHGSRLEVLPVQVSSISSGVGSQLVQLQQLGVHLQLTANRQLKSI